MKEIKNFKLTDFDVVGGGFLDFATRSAVAQMIQNKTNKAVVLGKKGITTLEFTERHDNDVWYLDVNYMDGDKILATADVEISPCNGTNVICVTTLKVGLRTNYADRFEYSYI